MFLCLGTYLLAFAIRLYLIRTDTTYISDTDSSSSEWDLSFQILAAMYRALDTFVLLIPFAAVLFLLHYVTSRHKES